MDKVLNKKIELNKSDKVKISIIIGFIIGVVSVIIYNSIITGIN